MLTGHVIQVRQARALARNEPSRIQVLLALPFRGPRGMPCRLLVRPARTADWPCCLRGWRGGDPVVDYGEYEVRWRARICRVNLLVSETGTVRAKRGREWSKIQNHGVRVLTDVEIWRLRLERFEGNPIIAYRHISLDLLHYQCMYSSVQLHADPYEWQGTHW